MIEIDIIARRGAIIALVEVKYRHHRDDGLRAVDPRTATRLRAAAEQIAAQTLARGEQRSVRVDMIAISPWRWPMHVADIVR